MLTDVGYRLARRNEICTRNESTVRASDEFWRKSVRFQHEGRRRLETCRTELLIRRKLTQGRLPHDREATTDGRPGRGGRCDGCETTSPLDATGHRDRKGRRATREAACLLR